MKHLTFILFSILIFKQCSSLDIHIKISEFYQEEFWLKEITDSRYKGRKTGTHECAQIGNYIISELEKMGYSPTEQRFMFKDSISMRNIIVELPGRTDSVIVIGAHYDGAITSSQYQGALDNGSGIITLLSICQKLVDQTPNHKVLCCFWDGEEYTTSSAYNGSTYFVKNYRDLSLVREYINLDCFGGTEDVIKLFYSVDKEDVAQFYKNRYITDFEVLCTERFSYSSDFVSFYNSGISFWGWNDLTKPDLHKYSDTIDKVSFQKIRFVSRFTRDYIINK